MGSRQDADRDDEWDILAAAGEAATSPPAPMQYGHREAWSTKPGRQWGRYLTGHNTLSLCRYGSVGTPPSGQNRTESCRTNALLDILGAPFVSDRIAESDGYL